MGSVATSAVPMREKTSFTSGNFRSTASLCFCNSTDAVSPALLLLFQRPASRQEAAVVLDALADAVETFLEGRLDHDLEQARVFDQAVLALGEVVADDGAAFGQARTQRARARPGAAGGPRGHGDHHRDERAAVPGRDVRADPRRGLPAAADDVMAARQTGWAMLCSNSVQEAHDLAAIAHHGLLHRVEGEGAAAGAGFENTRRARRHAGYRRCKPR